MLFSKFVNSDSDCEAGQYWGENNGNSQCLNCPEGTYGPDGRTCLTCQPGSTSAEWASSCQACDDTQIITGSVCTKCNDNQIPNADKVKILSYKWKTRN